MPRRRPDPNDELDDDSSDEGEVQYDDLDSEENDGDTLDVPELDVEGTVPSDAEITKQAARARSGVDTVYCEFRARSERTIGELDRIESLALRTFEKATGGTVRVQALRAATSAAWTKHRIADQVIVRGQELGVLPTAAKQSRTSVTVSGGVLLGAMSNDELMKRQRELVQEGKRIRTEYGAGQFASFRDPDDIYEGDLEEDAVDAEPVRVRRQKA